MEVAVSCCHFQSGSAIVPKDGVSPDMIQIWDPNNGTIYFNLKGNSSLPNCVSFIGSDWLAAIQADSPALYVWNWKKVRKNKLIILATTCDEMYSI